ncbi:transposase [Xenorhabdus miraniensis]|uniref:Transposase n=1 Tax=Xenorhabdus miraniensis TaxID=351674 RepID=A0A2D0JMW8_9GAMM|nr:transposase [Xenorhabdus miraniensis]
MATALASQIKLVGDIIRTYNERIEALFDTMPDADLFKSLPGMGPAWAHECLRHWAITVTTLTMQKKFKTTQASHR